MLATRTAYAETLAKQDEARRAVQLGPWHLAGPPTADKLPAGAKVDLNAKTPDGQPCWTARREWQDAKLFDWPGNPAVLCRTVTASKPVALLIGVELNTVPNAHTTNEAVVGESVDVTGTKDIGLDGTNVLTTNDLIGLPTVDGGLLQDLVTDVADGPGV